VAKGKRKVVKQGVSARPDCSFLEEETLEAYLLGRLPGQQLNREDDPEVQSVEEHLLWCEVCQAKAESEEKEIRALRAALLRCEPSYGQAPASKKPKPAKTMTAGM
jgi:hypothetical protein